jgi:cytochrome c2
MKVNERNAFTLACGTVAAAVMIGAASLVISQPAAATAQFGKDTGKSCGDCHTNPQGGGALTTFGQQFKANGNKLPK